MKTLFLLLVSKVAFADPFANTQCSVDLQRAVQDQVNIQLPGAVADLPDATPFDGGSEVWIEVSVRREGAEIAHWRVLGGESCQILTVERIR